MERWLGAQTQQYKAQQPDPKEHTSSLLTVWRKERFLLAAGAQ